MTFKELCEKATPRPWSGTCTVPLEYVGDDNGQEMEADYELSELSVNNVEAIVVALRGLMEATAGNSLSLITKAMIKATSALAPFEEEL